MLIMRDQLAINGGQPARKTFLPLGKPLLGKEEKDEVLDTLNSDWISKGPKTKRFEEEIKKYTGSSYAVAVSSCTAGLHIALRSLDIKKGDQVITSPLTFVATANAICYTGAVPILADIEQSSFNIDVSLLENKINEHTKAILPVHFAGLPCDMDKIKSIADKYNLPVVEDAAHAIGAEYKEKKIGNISDITVFSFYATKNITTGDGGMVTTSNEDLARKMEILSFHGLSHDAWKRYSPKADAGYEMVELGYKYNMTDIQAAIGIHQLKKLDGFIRSRKKIAEIYDENFSEIPEIVVQKAKINGEHARHLYPIIIKFEDLQTDRNGFIDALKAENIGCGIHYTAIHLHQYYRNRFEYMNSAFPNATYISERTISLPLYPGLTEDDIYDVVHAIKKLINFFSK